MLSVAAPLAPTVRSAPLPTMKSASSSLTFSTPVLPAPFPSTTLPLEVNVPVVSVTVALSGLTLPIVTPVDAVCGLVMFSVTVPCRYVCVRLAATVELNDVVYVAARLNVRSSAAAGTCAGSQFVEVAADPPAGLFQLSAAPLALLLFVVVANMSSAVTQLGVARHRTDSNIVIRPYLGMRIRMGYS